MTTQDLWQNQVGAPSIISESGNYVEGFPFYVVNDIAITKIGMYRGATGATGMPSQLQLYNLSAGIPVAGTLVTSPTDNGAVGWQWTTLPSPVALAAGVLYCACYLVPSGRTISYLGSGARPTPPSFFTFPSNTRYYAASATWTLPTSGDSGQRSYWVSVTADDTAAGGVGPGSATPADVNAAMVSWLADTTDNQHRAGDSVPGLPDETYQAVAATKTLAEGATGFDAIKAVADAIASAVSGIPGTIASAVTTITGQVTSSAATVMGTGLHTIGDIYGHTTDLLSHLADLVAGNAGGTSGALSGRSGFPTVLWTLADERDWTGHLAWAVPADLYVLSITDANGAPPTVVDGVNWYPRLGWWAPLTSTLVGDRRFFEFDACRLEDGGRRMAGILLKANDGLVSGHIQAWVLT